MNPTRRLFTTATVLVFGATALGGAAVAAPKEPKEAKKPKGHHNNGQRLLGEKRKTNGRHALHQKGDHAVSVEVKDGKVAAVHVKHAKKGEVPVKKYKTTKKMAHREGLQYATYYPVQYQDLGTVYIGYAYIDDYGDEVIYWFPYDMILDGDTGAIEYVPVY